MLPRSPSVRQRPADAPPPTATPIGVGIDTSRYGHYAAFLDPDLQTAAPDLDVIESAVGYSKLRQRLVDLVAHRGRVHVHVHVRLDAAGLDADNLLAWLGALAIDHAAFTLSRVAAPSATRTFASPSTATRSPTPSRPAPAPATP